MKVIVVQKKSKGFEIPDDGVILWYGIASEVPEGFAIYTELNGRMPYGGSAKDITARGSSTHIHSFSSTAVSWQLAHAHTATNGSKSGGSAADYGYGSGTIASANHTHAIRMDSITSEGAHRHTVGNTGSGTTLPKHKKLYYIKAVA